MRAHDGAVHRDRPIQVLIGVWLGDGTIGCWDAGSGEQRWRVLDDPGAFSFTVIRPPGGRMLLASGGEEGVCRWDLLTGEPPSGNLTEGDTIWSVAAGGLPDGRSILAGAGNDYLVYRWDAVTGQPIVSSLSSTTLPSGQILLASSDHEGDIRRWDAVTREPIGRPIHTARRGGPVMAGPAPGGPRLFALCEDRSYGSSTR